METIWLNHWFSTAYDIVRLIKADNPAFRIISTNENDLSPIKAICDEWYKEPVIKGKDYAEFCLQFCLDHEVTVFMPRRHLTTISEYRNIFDEAGVRVMVDEYDTVRILNDKVKAYEEFSNRGLGIVPEYRLVTNVGEFEKAYQELTEKFGSVCFKFVKDEGGKSYRRIDNRAKGYETLFKKKTTRITFDEARACLSERSEFSPMMVMPYLPGDEISIDCLAMPERLIAIPRVKTESRVEQIRYDSDLIETCKAVVKSFKLENPCNIQFKIRDGIPYLLEVNTRMSGGIHMTCAGSGVNIPSLAVNKLLGRILDANYEQQECFVTQVEIPIVL